MSSPNKIPSDPPAIQYSSSPLSRTPSSMVRSKDRSFDGSGTRSVVSDLVNDRRERSGQSNKLNIQSSPLAERNRKDEQSRKLNEMRTTRNDKKRIERRGGLDKMEEMVMDGEKAIEDKRLHHNATEHSIPAELAADIEKEQQEEMELYDDDLIEFIEQKEQWERELEEMMSEFSIT
ncbi:similar to Saccharomyces cerevisiae YER104W RTT105 Protein with a role in regulation of Ty1 transposition [Maudiozyma saulgeensis]|uniref:Similar to Saccharomyces cerevisiae YER104W RTT105 Protein with a role in regulation of Ty1 transposition n=1 Tax=Maudiozyma saulgeensis TaxID=1789683 RepID=A0A1X7QXS5_9SACH|nr:similar to Saccharomyces cerevisiae YER104W RTT105 Protein with a role in regulation of Ty1 transposition [Kazachstania saulgeensis]